MRQRVTCSVVHKRLNKIQQFLRTGLAYNVQMEITWGGGGGVGGIQDLLSPSNYYVYTRLYDNVTMQIWEVTCSVNVTMGGSEQFLLTTQVETLIIQFASISRSRALADFDYNIMLLPALVEH